MLALAHLVSKAIAMKPCLVRQIATTSVTSGKFFADAEDKRIYSFLYVKATIYLCKIFVFAVGYANTLLIIG